MAIVKMKYAMVEKTFYVQGIFLNLNECFLDIILFLSSWENCFHAQEYSLTSEEHFILLGEYTQDAE
jgi:hypothetical protein